MVNAGDKMKAVVSGVKKVHLEYQVTLKLDGVLAGLAIRAFFQGGLREGIGKPPATGKGPSQECEGNKPAGAKDEGRRRLPTGLQVVVLQKRALQFQIPPPKTNIRKRKGDGKTIQQGPCVGKAQVIGVFECQVAGDQFAG